MRSRLQLCNVSHRNLYGIRKVKMLVAFSSPHLPASGYPALDSALDHSLTFFMMSGFNSTAHSDEVFFSNSLFVMFQSSLSW